MSRKDFLPGATLNSRYEILSKIGDGGMGNVVKARQLSDDAIVAIKYCTLHDPDDRRRFVREVRIMKRIKHPHVVSVLRTGLKHKPPYFVMPVADCSLQSKLTTICKDEDKGLRVFLELCEGVQAIHTAGAIHRDIKPDNALIFNERVVVADLGLAKLCIRDTTILTQSRAQVGTQMYLAPEQRLPAGSRDADERTDIYQLGKTLYQLITGADPVLIDMGKMPPGLAHIVRKATQDHPDNRYQKVGELVDAVMVYKQAKDPDANPLSAFEDVISRIAERLEKSEYRESDVKQLLAIMMNPTVVAEKEQFLELFDRIPSEILRIAASVFSELFEPILQSYVEVIDDQVGSHSFSYAEHVALTMSPIFNADGAAAEVKSLALEAVLLAGVHLNRFAAMESFNSMLASVEPDIAFQVADMLKRRSREYRGIAANVASIKLNPIIRAAKEAVLATTK